MSSLSEPTFVAVYVVFGALSAIGFLVVVLVVYSVLKNKYGDKMCKCCLKSSNQSGRNNASQKQFHF
jgi:hypothetical protein